MIAEAFPWAEALRHAVAADGGFLRPLAAATVFAAVRLAVGRPFPVWLDALVALAFSLWVLGAAWPAFVAVCGIAYGVVALAAVTRQRRGIAMTWLALLSAAFVAARAFGWDRASTEVGGARVAVYYLDMWMLLRLFTFTWEVGHGLVALPGVTRFAAWVACPLLLGGPLVRLSQWPAVMAPDRRVVCPSGWRPGLEGLGMIATGFAIVAAAAALGARVGSDALALKAASVLFVGPWAFYLTVGGFFRTVEWLGAASGVVVPASFRFPFFTPNIAAFWASWNLTATGVFRDYFFYNRWGLRSYSLYANTVIVFLAVGLWHGSNAYWVCFGLLHGLYFCVYLWSRPRVARFAGRPWFEASSVVVTYVAICAAWYLPSKIALMLRG